MNRSLPAALQILALAHAAGVEAQEVATADAPVDAAEAEAEDDEDDRAPRPLRWGRSHYLAFEPGVRIHRHVGAAFQLDVHGGYTAAPPALPRFAFGLGAGAIAASRARTAYSLLAHVDAVFVIGVGGTSRFDPRYVFEQAFVIEPRLLYGRVNGSGGQLGYGVTLRFVPNFGQWISIGVDWERYPDLGSNGHYVAAVLRFVPTIPPRRVEAGPCGPWLGPMRD